MNSPDWSTVTEFENKIAEFFGAPHAVAVVVEHRCHPRHIKRIADFFGIKLLRDIVEVTKA